MSSELRHRALVSLGLAVVLIAATSCGQSAGRTPAGPSGTIMESETVQAAAGQRPVVSGVRITSSTAQGSRARYTLAATVTDANGDVVGGRLRLRVVSTGQVLERPITATANASEVETEETITVAAATLEAATLRGTQFSATLSLSPVPASSVRLAVSVKDRAGNRSAEVSFTAPVPSGGRGAGLNAQEAAQVRRDITSLVASLVGARREQAQSAATFSTSISLACPAGGNVSAFVTATVDANGTTTVINGNGNARLNTCRLGGGLEARGAIAFSFSGLCPPSLTVTVRGRIQVLKNGMLVDNGFDINESATAPC